MGLRPDGWLDFRARNISEQNPSEMATALLKHFGLEFPPIGIGTILKGLGIEAKTTEDLHIVIADPTTKPAVVLISSTAGTVRKRFAAAHALGHLLFDALGVQHMDSTFGDATEPHEKRANEFAAALLAPLWLVEPIATAKRRTTTELAAVFEVSTSVMTHQLRKIVSF